MKDSLDLLLRSQADGSVLALLVGPDLQTTFSVPEPQRLDAQYRAWLDRFVAHHDPNKPQIPGHVLQNYSDRLLREMQQWLQQPEWNPLIQALQANPTLPLRLDVESSLAQLIRLPWESSIPEHSIWRTQQNQTANKANKKTVRQLACCCWL